MIRFDFRGRSAVVTGASGGMGEHIAQAMAEAGCRVTAVDVKPCPESLAGLDNVVFARGDLTDQTFVAGFARDTHERTGRLDYLCNVAGVLWFDRDRSVFDIDLDVWDRVFEVNLKSMVHTVRACIPRMKASPGAGAMVHFSTIQWMRGDTVPQDAYAASKAAVSAFSRSLAMQLAADGIRSNVVCPGLTLTPMQARWDTQEVQDRIAQTIPVGRLGRPEDMANTAMFLLSDGADYITGVDVVVDGGQLLKS